jgi:phosphoribosylanthranilate isomerase
MCGTTSLEDARAAVDMGVDALGFIFSRKSPRYIEPGRAAEIISLLPPFITRVGVFVDSTIDTVRTIIRSAGLTQVQLHGSEAAVFCAELKAAEKSCSVCKAFRISRKQLQNTDMAKQISVYEQVVDSVLLDSYQKGLEGGTGAAFDWQLIDELGLQKPLILAGGLNSVNVAEAVRRVRPYAIDVNSGVEDAPGKKNHQQLKALIDTVNKVLAELRRQG